MLAIGPQRNEGRQSEQSLKAARLAFRAASGDSPTNSGLKIAKRQSRNAGTKTLLPLGHMMLNGNGRNALRGLLSVAMLRSNLGRNSVTLNFLTKKSLDGGKSVAETTVELIRRKLPESAGRDIWPIGTRCLQKLSNAMPGSKPKIQSDSRLGVRRLIEIEGPAARILLANTKQLTSSGYGTSRKAAACSASSCLSQRNFMSIITFRWQRADQMIAATFASFTKSAICKSLHAIRLNMLKSTECFFGSSAPSLGEVR